MEVVTNGTVGDWRLSDADFLLHFQLPTENQKLHTLDLVNAFERDARIQFVEDTHTYWITNPDGTRVRAPISATGFLARFHAEFDADAVIPKMRANTRTWPTKRLEFIKEDGTEMNDEEIKNKWRINGNVASSRGTLMHYQIEQYFNGATIEEPHSPEFKQFLIFEQQIMKVRGLVPFLTEASLFHCGLKLAGQSDLLCRQPDGRIAILDWKRSKEIVMHNRFQRMLPPFDTFSDCNFFHYALQLNLYKYIIESEYGEQVGSMLLGVFHPNQTEPQCIEIPVLQRELDVLISQLCDQKLATDPVPGPYVFFTL
jgi:hypothetical protein